MVKNSLVKKTYIIFCLFFLVCVKSSAAQVLINETIDVKAGYYTYYKLSSPIAVKWIFEITVLEGGNKDINIWFMDSANFVKFPDFLLGLQSIMIFPDVSKKRATNLSSTFFPRLNEIYYLVFDNTFSIITNKKVSVYVYSVNISTPSPTTTSTTTTTIPVTTSTTTTIPSTLSFNDAIQLKTELESAIEWVETNVWKKDEFHPPVGFDLKFGCDSPNAGAYPLWNYIEFCHSLFADLQSIFKPDLDDALAYIIAHELGHIYWMHEKKSFVDRLNNLNDVEEFIIFTATIVNPAVAAFILVLYNLDTRYFNHQQELEADSFAVDFAMFLGYTPDGFIAWLKKKSMGPGDLILYLIGDHPGAEERISNIRRRQQTAREWFGAWKIIKNQVGSGE